MMKEEPFYNKNHPFLAKIVERHLLCKEGSRKQTYHIAVDLSGSGIVYKVGDSIAIQPKNDPIIVERMLKALKAKGDESVLPKGAQESLTLYDYLVDKANLAVVPRKLVALLAEMQTEPKKKEALSSLLNEENKEAFKAYVEEHEVWDALEENPEVTAAAQDLSQILQPLLPRFYSIASSMRSVGNQVHLTVIEQLYETNQQLRRGVCTHFLCRLAPLNVSVVPVYLHPSSGFTLPDDDSAPIIMVGPGTGVAPYRGFLQERMARKASGRNWLFFGEWHRQTEFFYEEYWKSLVGQGALRLETAFSRDQEEKIYVQHRMTEQGKELFQWLEEGAYFYVCGDAKRMAKDVDIALHQIIKEHSQLNEQGTRDYVKRLRAEKRYLRDVY